nr:40S ribosomal protein S27-2 [Ipomoea batatas]
MSILNSEASPCDKISKSHMHKGSSVQRYKPEINVQAINQGEETGGVPWLRRQERRWRTGLCPSGLWSGEARHEMEGWSLLVLPNDVDLLNPPAELEKKKHKLKRLVQSPNSFFMDVKCQGCFNITTVFSHSQTVVVCGNCQTVLCQPTGGRARLTEGCSFRRKGD